MEGWPSTRKEAKEEGYNYYFTGKPCKNGHIDLRQTTNATCKSCKKKYWKKYYRDNLERRKDSNRVWNRENREWYRNYMREWRKLNPVKNKEAEKRWRENNRDKRIIYNSKRRSLKQQAIPKWIDWDEIEYIYKLASEKGLVVDHIVPLNSPYVCGLHTGDNLRCIPAKLNLIKGNRYWPDMPEELVEIGE